MKPVLLLLLAAVVGCNADFITIRSQPMQQGSGMQGPRLFVVNSQSEEAAPRALGLLSRLQLQPSAGAMQDLASPFSTVLGGRAGSFFDSSLTSWVDQQVAALDQLQAQLGPPPVLASGCPRLAAMRAAAAAGAASLPQDALSYLAASRFGPGLLVSFSQQDSPFDLDWQLAGAEAGDDDEGYVGEEEGDVDADEDDGEELTFDAAGVMGDYWVDAGGASLPGGGPYRQQRPAMLTASGVGLATTSAGRGFMPSMLSEDDSAAFYPASGVADNMEGVDEDDDGPTWFFVLEDGSLNWGLICFLALALAVVPLWLWNIRALVRLLAGVPSSSPGGGRSRCCPFSRPGAARRQPEQPLKAPLLAEYLAPLAPEKPVAEKPAPELLTAVEVASEQTPQGEYVAPSNNQFVTVRYVPLKGEEV